MEAREEGWLRGTEKGQFIPLLSVSVSAQVTLVCAKVSLQESPFFMSLTRKKVTIEQVYENKANNPIEAVFSFPVGCCCILWFFIDISNQISKQLSVDLK